MGMVVRGDVYLVNLDPTIGAEIQKTRPCLVVSPDEMNKYIKTIMIAPLTTTVRNYKSRVTIHFKRQKGQVILDQVRTIDKERLIKRLGYLSDNEMANTLSVLQEMFAY